MKVIDTVSGEIFNKALGSKAAVVCLFNICFQQVDVSAGCSQRANNFLSTGGLRFVFKGCWEALRKTRGAC